MVSLYQEPFLQSNLPLRMGRKSKRTRNKTLLKPQNVVNRGLRIILAGSKLNYNTVETNSGIHELNYNTVETNLFSCEESMIDSLDFYSQSIITHIGTIMRPCPSCTAYILRFICERFLEQFYNICRISK